MVNVVNGKAMLEMGRHGFGDIYGKADCKSAYVPSGIANAAWQGDPIL